MEWMELVNQLANICLVPILGALTAFVVKWINVKAEEIIQRIENDKADKYVKMLAETITDCVIATNQTYVNNLKADNLFDERAQQEALRLTHEAIMQILTEDAKEYLTELYGDLSAYLMVKIEAEITKQK